MLLKLFPKNPNQKTVAQIGDILRNDGVIIYPTEGVYAFGCSLHSPKAVEKLKNISGKDTDRLSVMCADLSHISDYAKIDNTTFRILKRNLPGPFTFILTASSRVPDKVLAKRKTIGVRVSKNGIPQAIIEEIGYPLLTASVKNHALEEEYTTDPELIYEQWGDKVDAVIDGGYGSLEPTTLVDCTGEVPEVREGGGELEL